MSTSICFPEVWLISAGLIQASLLEAVIWVGLRTAPPCVSLWVPGQGAGNTREKQFLWQVLYCKRASSTGNAYSHAQSQGTKKSTLLTTRLLKGCVVMILFQENAKFWSLLQSTMQSYHMVVSELILCNLWNNNKQFKNHALSPTISFFKCMKQI